MAEYPSLLRFALACGAGGATITLQRINNVLSDIDENMLKGMLTQGVRLQNVTFEPNTALSVPWRRIVCEKTNNNQRCCGYNRYQAQGTNSGAFVGISKLVSRANSSMIITGSGSLMSKVLLALFKNPTHGIPFGVDSSQA